MEIMILVGDDAILLGIELAPLSEDDEDEDEMPNVRIEDGFGEVSDSPWLRS